MISLSAYLPVDRRYALAQGAPLPDRAQGTVLFADISGSTPLTAALAQELGLQRGAEALTHHLNRLYGALITEVHRYRGSVIGFSGDAITCWFAETDHQPLPPPTFRASACALAMQKVVRQQEPIQIGPGRVTFGIKVAIATGPVRRFLVGYPHIQVIDVLAGATVDQVGEAEKLAHQGEIVVAAEVITRLGPQAAIATRRTAPSGRSFAVLSGLNQPIAPSPWTEIPETPPDLARQWVLPPVYQRLQRGEGGFLAELRSAVTLFLHFGGIDYDADDEAGLKLDTYIRWVQSILSRYEGFLIQVTMGDKGSYLCAVFGAPVAHEDDPARATAAALDLRSPPIALSFAGSPQIGISQGLMHAGGYGGPMRQTYGVLGNEANVAARLMGQAGPGQVLVTKRIMQATQQQCRFQALEPVTLKGLAKPLPLFALEGKRAKARPDMLKGRAPSTMIGRESQRQALAGQLKALRGGQSSCVVIEGEAGIGKSRLVMDLLDHARSLGVQALVGAGDGVDQSTAYHAWRPLFRHFFGFDSLEEAGTATVPAWRAATADWIAAHTPHLAPLLPLINVVLPLDLPENELTAQLSGEVRANNTYDLLLGLLQAKAQVAPLLIILEDVHWLDSASWMLARLVHRDIRPLLLALVTRPMVENAPAEYSALLDAPQTSLLQLETLAPAEVEALVCQRLGVRALPARVARLIHEKAGGHPFFSEELAYALRDTGLIEVVDGECLVTPQAGALRAMDFPDTIQGVITSRIDRLDPEHQLTLKVASVIGRIFALAVLRHIFPVEKDKTDLPRYLGDLERAAITTLEATEPDLSYIFKHVITQEVAYSLLLYVQRQALHRAVAEWYEHTLSDDLSAYYPLLAYHWRNAENLSAAIDYLEKAAAQALRNNANQEAIRFLDEALALNNQLGGDDRLRLARWHRQLGDAYMRLGLMQDSLAYYQKTLQILQRPVPATPLRTVLSILRQVVRQTAHRFWPQYFLGRSRGLEAALTAEAARTYQELILIYYLSNNIALFLHSILYALNLAEEANSPRELAEGYATMCVVAGAVPQLNLAPVYEPKALQAAQSLNTSSILGFVLLRIGTYKTTVGHWPEGRNLIEEAITHYERINDPRGWGDAINVLGIWCELCGHFEEGANIFHDLYTQAKKHNNVQHEGWGLGGQATCLLRLGRNAEARAKAEEALRDQHVGEVQTFMDYSTVALASLRLGETERAVATAGQALALMRGVTPTAFMVASFFNLGLVYLSAWEAVSANRPDVSTLDAREMARGVTQVYKVLYRFPIGKPAAWLCQGSHAWLSGKPAKARAAWQKSLEAAERQGMPYEAAWAHYEIGRRLPDHDPARLDHLQQAVTTFERLGAAERHAAPESAAHLTLLPPHTKA